MLPEKIQHRGRPFLGPSHVIAKTNHRSSRTGGRFLGSIRIGSARIGAGVNALVMIVEDYVIDNHSGCVEFSRELLAVGTDAADVASVMNMHRSRGRIEDLNLFVAGRMSGNRRLRAWIVERAERIGSRINRGRRDIWTIHGVKKTHRGSVRPSRYVDSTVIDVAGCDLSGDGMIDGCCIRIFTPGRVSNLYVARRVKLAIPIVPSDSFVVRERIVVRRFTSFRS